jgi:hypothetical protein
VILRDVVDSFGNLILQPEYAITAVSDNGTDYLFGYLDYSVYHEGRRHMPQLVVLEVKRCSKKHIMQCQAQMAAIHQQRKLFQQHKDVKVFGIRTSGSIWTFLQVETDGCLWRSPEYIIRQESIDESVYRLIHSVVREAYRSNPNSAFVRISINQNQLFFMETVESFHIFERLKLQKKVLYHLNELQRTNATLSLLFFDYKIFVDNLLFPFPTNLTKNCT